MTTAQKPKKLDASVLEPLLTSREAGRYFGKTETAMAQWRHLGTGPRFIRLDRRTIRYRESDLAAFVATKAEGGSTRVA